MTYEEKLKIANDHLKSLGLPVKWDDLEDTNSLYDCETEEDIKLAAEERASENGFDISGVEKEEEDNYEGIEEEDDEEIE